MQALWSKATQLKSSCRCPSCLSAPTAAVVRRSSTATPGQRIRFGDAITIFYSSVLATAAVADAGWKDTKRETLEDSIAKAIADLKATEREQERRIQVLLKNHAELRDIDDDGAQSVEKLHVLCLKPPSTKFGDPPCASLPKLWRNGGRAPIRHNAYSRAPDSGRHYGTSTRLRETWPTMKQTPLKLGKEVQPHGGAGGGRSNDDPGAALEQHDRLSLMKANDTGPATTRTKLWTSAGADYPLHVEASIPRSTVANVELGTLDGTKYQQEGVKTHFKIRNSLRKDPGWATRRYMDNSTSTTPKTQLPNDTSQDTDPRLPTLRYRPSGMGPKEKLSYKLDTLCLKHINGGFPLWTLPRGQTNIKIWEHACSLRPLDGSQMSRLEMSVAKLIYRLLIMAIDASETGSILLKLPRAEAGQLARGDQQMLEEIIVQLDDRLLARQSSKHTWSKSSLFPEYSQEVRDTTDLWNLNEDLLHVLPNFTELVELLPRICYELLASPTPPDVHTYNILITHLCYLQHCDAAAAVITSMADSDILPNEITTAAILRFFTHTDDAKRFEEYADFLNFRSITAVMKPVPESAMTAGSTAYRFGHKDKSPSNAATHKALILGWLRFERLELALVEYHIMVHSGLLMRRPNLDRRLLVAFLQHCAKSNNWEWGSAIWRDLIERRNRGQYDLILEQYYWMLQLCVVCRRPSEFETVLQDGISKGLKWRLGTLQMGDFVSDLEDLRHLTHKVKLMERLRDSHALLDHDKPKVIAPKLWRVLNLSDWISHSLGIIDPQRRRRAIRARPVASISTRPRNPFHTPPDRDEGDFPDNQEAVRSAGGVRGKSRNVNVFAQPKTLEEIILGHGGRAPAVEDQYTRDWEYGRLEEFPLDKTPTSLPAWL